MEKINFQDLPSTSTPLNSTNLNQMQDNMEDAIIPIKLVTISTTAPSSATTGDMYYNTTDNKIYTAIGENTWDSGSTPRYDGFYVNTSNNTLFYYNGSTLIGVGGSSSGIGGDTLPVGMIMPGAFPSTVVVEDWLKCDGSAVSRTEYSELFNAIGVSYGSGDGSTTFNLPNIKGKMIIGYDPDDDDFDTIGATGGSKTHTQTENELAGHRHIVNSSIGAKHPIVPYADGAGNPGGGNTNYTLKMTGVTNDTSPYLRTNYIGNAQPMDIMNPYIVLNYYIKAHKTAPIYATVKNEETTSETDVYSCNYINGLKTELYNKSTGETGNITLNDNLSNYDYIEIYYENPTFNRWGSSKIDNPNGKTTSLTVGMRYDVNGSYYTYFKDVSFNGTSITHLYGGYFAVQTNGIIEFFNNNNYIAITKVIGYKN